MFEHIMIAYDGSQPAERALEAGARISRGTGARVTLFHCLLEGPIPEHIQKYLPRASSPSDGGSLSALYESASLRNEEIEEIGRKLVENASATLKAYGIEDCATVTGSGDAAHSIIEHARNNGVDTIVIGSRGNGPIAELIMGGVSHKVVNTFNGSVLTVH